MHAERGGGGESEAGRETLRVEGFEVWGLGFRVIANRGGAGGGSLGLRGLRFKTWGLGFSD